MGWGRWEEGIAGASVKDAWTGSGGVRDGGWWWGGGGGWMSGRDVGSAGVGCRVGERRHTTVTE